MLLTLSVELKQLFQTDKMKLHHSINLHYYILKDSLNRLRRKLYPLLINPARQKLVPEAVVSSTLANLTWVYERWQVASVLLVA